MHIIIDGYNLIRQSDRLRRAEKFTLEEGRHSLIRFLVPYRERKGHRLTVVVDGWDGGSFHEERDREGGIDIIYSRKGEKADDLIKRMAERSGDELVVVTSDRDIAHFVERCGSTVVTSQTFEGIVNEDQPMKLSPSFCHVIADKKDDDLFQEKKGAKKKGPAKKTSRKEREYNKRLVKL